MWPKVASLQASRRGVSRRRAWARAVAVAASCLGLASCGTQSNEAAVKSTVRTFLSSLGVDGRKACSTLTTEAQYALVSYAERTPCEKAALSIHTGGLALSYFEDNYDGTRFFGTNHQTAEVDLQPPASFASLQSIPLTKTDGQWKITDVSWYYR